MSLSTSNSSADTKGIKKYLGGFFLFILLLFLFDRALFLVIERVEAGFYSKNKFEQRFKRYMKDKRFNTLIFGTSRTYEGIHPYYIEKILGQKAFKETFQGKGPKYNYYFYRLYKKYAGTPKVVIYGVDYFIYTLTSDRKYMARFDPKWMARFDIKNREKKINYFSSPLLLVEHKKKIDNFYNNILIRLKEKRSPDQESGSIQDFIDIQEYTGADLPPKKVITKRPPKFTRQFYPRSPGEEGHFFMDLLDELDRDNVTVVLVLLPDYFGTYKTNFQRNDFIQHLKTLKRKYKKLFIYNYNRPRRFKLDNPFYFIDGGYGNSNSHLSKKGAREFNNLLAKDLRKHYRQPPAVDPFP